MSMSAALPTTSRPSTIIPATPERLAPGSTLPSATWAEFANKAFERDTVVLPNVTQGPLIPAVELMHAMITAADAFRGGNADGAFVIWVGGEKLSDPTDLLPVAGDSSLQAYLERVHRRLGGPEFTILLANPHVYNDDIRRRTWAFMAGLIEHTGIPCGGIDSGIFLGRYTKTPFGVHRGQMSVLTFPVLGKKRFLLWPRGYGEENSDIRDSVSYDRHLPHAIERVAGAGDMMYWPADFWHIADDAIDYTAAFNIGLWWDRSPLQRAIYAFTDAVATEAEAISDTDIIAEGRGMCLGGGRLAVGKLAGLPDEFTHALDLVRRACSGSVFESIALAEWLKLRSSNGFRELPEPAPSPQADVAAELIPIGPDAIIASPTLDGRLIVAANGRATVIPDHPLIRITLRELAAGRPAAFASAGDLDAAGRVIATRLIDLIVTNRAAGIAQ